MSARTLSEVSEGRDSEILAEVMVELEATRSASFLTDCDLTLRWASTEMRAFLETDDPEALGYGRHLIDALMLPTWTSKITDVGSNSISRRIVPYAAAHAQQCELPMGDTLRALCRDLGVEPTLPPSFWTGTFDYVEPDGTTIPSRYSVTLLGHPTAGFIGCACIVGTPLRARVSELLTRGDEAMYERIADLSVPRQEAAAVLFADLENSAALSRRLSTSAYFDLIRRLLTTIDRTIAGYDGIVGKHAGDGATGFFRAADTGSPSCAARAAIDTARDIARAARDFDVMLNVGVHYAPAVYLGQLITSGRLEVTALGDDVTIAARLQESAREGSILASKLLLEQLDADDAKLLALDPAGATYTPLDEWPTASEKARRDAPRLPVCPLPVDPSR